MPNGASSDAHRIYGDRIPALHCNLDCLEMCVHMNVESSDGAMNKSPVFQLNGDRLVAELH